MSNSQRAKTSSHMKKKKMQKVSGGVKKFKVRAFQKKITAELEKDVHKGKGN